MSGPKITLNAKSIRPFGKIINYPNKASKGNKRNLWRIVHTEKQKVGWRIAYLILRDKTLGRMEQHPTSDETFEPVKGRALMFVAKDKKLKDIVCFELNQPILLFKGTWHGLISITKEAEIKVTENSRVTCRYWKWPFRIKSAVDLRDRQKSLG